MSKPDNNSLLGAYLSCEVALKRFLGTFTCKPEDIDKLAQEAFLRAYQVQQKQTIQSPKSYLFSVVRNITLRELSKKIRQLTAYHEESIDESALASVSALGEELMAQQRLKQNREAVADMPGQCRQVFLLRKAHALSHKEIAAQLDISPSTVEKHIAREIDQFYLYG